MWSPPAGAVRALVPGPRHGHGGDVEPGRADGAALPGLSANPLDVEERWDGRPLRVWVARRLYDYAHLPRIKDSRTRPWVLTAREAARGPDNEPLVRDVRPLGWIEDRVITEADRVVRHHRNSWGPLDRGGTTGT
ncbi:DUF6098 family protein [Streptomyces nigra]|uniref:DUF6098 family protein n=1 Tax=Streptomyces nigra TaxID=1827580 RepID=UPI003CC63AF7